VKETHVKDRTAPHRATEATELVDRLTHELHRRSLRLEQLGDDPAVAEGVLMNVRGEVLGLQAALGMALGGEVAGGDADRLAHEHYTAWCARQGAVR
jgi:hypothetical protein